LEDLLFGTSGDRRTESGLTNDINRRNAQNADSRQAQTLEDLLFGTSTERRQGGGDVVRDTLRGDQAGRTDRGFEDDLLSAGLGRDATRAGLTGDFEGDRTLAGETFDSNSENQRIVQLLAAVKAGTIDGGAATNAIRELLGVSTVGNTFDNENRAPQSPTTPPDGSRLQPGGGAIGANGEQYIFHDGEWERLN
jgi:hypothetical protein